MQVKSVFVHGNSGHTRDLPLDWDYVIMEIVPSVSVHFAKVKAKRRKTLLCNEILFVNRDYMKVVKLF